MAPAEPSAGANVRFSVVVPTFDRPTQLAGCLRALASLEPPPGGYEIVVVNDGGTPPPAGALQEARAGRASDVRVVAQANGGPAAARNTGAAAARGSLLAFTDDDCRPEPDWLVALDAALCACPGALVGGRTVNEGEENVYRAASQSLVDFAGGYFDGGVAGRFFPANNLAVPRAAFLDTGGFDTRFRFAGEDREYCDRWWALGRPTAVQPAARVRHAHALTLADFLGLHFSYGRGAPAFRRKRAGAGRPVRIDPAFYVRSLHYPFTRAERRHAPAVALLTAVAHAAYAAGMLAERLTRTDPPA